MSTETRNILKTGRFDCPVYADKAAAQAAGCRSLTTPIILPGQVWILESIAADMQRLPAGTAWGVVLSTVHMHGNTYMAAQVWRAGMIEPGTRYIASNAPGWWRRSITGKDGDE